MVSLRRSEPCRRTLLHVVAARPNFMKVAPVMAALTAREREIEALRPDEAPPRFRQVLVHTGQHYDALMSDVFFADLDLPEPDHFLEIGAGSQAEQTAAVLTRLEPVLLEVRPDLVLVAGDVTSTLAVALAAAKLDIPVAHIEAGLRSFDRTMPEETNRILTDHLSSLLFTTCDDGDQNLEREGIGPDGVHQIGNTMIDSLTAHLDRVRALGVRKRFGLERRAYAVVTAHRPSNVDDRQALERLVAVLSDMAELVPVVFPAHVRTVAGLERHRLTERLSSSAGLHMIEPLGYAEFISLVCDARLVLTDSGGIQEETTVLGVPCLTMRDSTERPVTVREGTNRLVPPSDTAAVMSSVAEVLRAPMPHGRRPAGWDGAAAGRLVDVLARWAEAPAAWSTRVAGHVAPYAHDGPLAQRSSPADHRPQLRRRC